MITASASITKLSPGRYQLATALKDLIYPNHNPCNLNRGGRPRLSPEKRKPMTNHILKKKERERIWQEISALPDDERELWNRCSL
jgi:hypothetical protein